MGSDEQMILVSNGFPGMLKKRDQLLSGIEPRLMSSDGKSYLYQVLRFAADNEWAGGLLPLHQTAYPKRPKS